jgi:hypothetical protein
MIATIYLKSGNKINIDAEDITVNLEGSKLVGYNIENMDSKSDIVLFIDVESIEAVTYRKS